MNRTLVVYYSRTGYTERLAQSLAARLDADIDRIVDVHSRRGPFGYLRSAVEALRGIASRILPGRCDPARYELVVVAGPVWFGRCAPPVRAWIRRERAKLPAVAFACTFGGRGAPRALFEMHDAAGKPPRALLALTDAQILAGAEHEAVEAFARELHDHTPTHPALEAFAHAA